MLIPYQYSCVLSFACISTLLKVDQSVQTCHACCTLPEVSPLPVDQHSHTQLPAVLEPGELLWQLQSGPVVRTYTPYCANSVLVPAVEEFMSFPVAVPVLWFGFGMRTIVATR